MPTVTLRGSSAAARRGGFWALVLAVAVVVLGACWALASPVASSADDDFHLSSIWCSSSAPDDLCERGPKTLSEGQRSVIVPAQFGPPCFALGGPSTSAGCQAEIPEGTKAYSRANDGLYPGGYYALMGLFARADFVKSTLLMRAISWALSLGLITAAAIIADPIIRRTYVLAVLATSVPLGLFLFASNNPSGVTVAAIGAFWCCALNFLESASRRRRVASGLVGAVAALLALGARADAGLYLATAGACAILLARGWNAGRRWRAEAVASIGLVCIAVALSIGQTGAATSGADASNLDRPFTSTIWYNLINLPVLWTGSLGSGTRGLGWADTRMPEVVAVAMVAATAGLVVSGSVRWDRVRIAAVCLAAIPITVFPLFVLDANNAIVGEWVQPRYLLPMLPVVLGAMLLPSAERSGWPTRAQLMLVGVLVSVAHAAALHANIRRYVTGQDVIGPDLDARVEWWWDMPLRPMHIWFLGSLAFGVVVVSCVPLVGHLGIEARVAAEERVTDRRGAAKALSGMRRPPAQPLPQSSRQVDVRGVEQRHGER